MAGGSITTDMKPGSLCLERNFLYGIRITPESCLHQPAFSDLCPRLDKQPCGDCDERVGHTSTQDDRWLRTVGPTAVGASVCARAHTHACACSAVSDFLRLYGCSPPGSSFLGILRQECWSGLPFPPPGDLPDPGIKPTSLASPALAGRFFPAGRRGRLQTLPDTGYGKLRGPQQSSPGGNSTGSPQHTYLGSTVHFPSVQSQATS